MALNTDYTQQRWALRSRIGADSRWSAIDGDKRGSAARQSEIIVLARKIISRAQTLKVVRPAVFPPEQSNNNQACARRLAFECAADVRGRGVAVLLLMSIGAVETDLRSTKKMRDALTDDVSENQQSDQTEKNEKCSVRLRRR